MSMENLTKAEVINLINTAASSHQIDGVNFGKDPDTNRTIWFKDVLKQAVAYLEGKNEPTDIQLVDDMHRVFNIGSKWMHLHTLYVVSDHGTDGSVTFKSVNSEGTYLKYSAKQMLDIKKSFRRADVTDADRWQVVFKIGTHWEDPNGKLLQVFDYRTHTIAFRDMKDNQIIFRRYDDEQALNVLKPRKDLDEKVSLP